MVYDSFAKPLLFIFEQNCTLLLFTLDKIQCVCLLPQKRNQSKGENRNTYSNALLVVLRVKSLYDLPYAAKF